MNQGGQLYEWSALVKNLETFKVEWQKIFSAKTEHSSDVTSTTFKDILVSEAGVDQDSVPPNSSKSYWCHKYP